MTLDQENKLNARIVELEAMYRNSCRHRDELSEQLDRARALAIRLEAECAACGAPAHRFEDGNE